MDQTAMMSFLNEVMQTVVWALVGAVSMGISLGLLIKFFDWMTPVNEWNQIKNGNIAMGLVLWIFEEMIPHPIMFFKLGLGNIVTVVLSQSNIRKYSFYGAPLQKFSWRRSIAYARRFTSEIRFRVL